MQLVLKEYQASDFVAPHLKLLFFLKIIIIKLLLLHLSCEIFSSVVEQVSGRDHVLNHLSIPAACFTHPEISMVGLTEVSVKSLQVFFSNDHQIKVSLLNIKSLD